MVTDFTKLVDEYTIDVQDADRSMSASIGFSDILTDLLRSVVADGGIIDMKPDGVLAVTFMDSAWQDEHGKVPPTPEMDGSSPELEAAYKQFQNNYNRVVCRLRTTPLEFDIVNFQDPEVLTEAIQAIAQDMHDFIAAVLQGSGHITLLEEPTLYVKREAYMVTMYAYSMGYRHGVKLIHTELVFDG